MESVQANPLIGIEYTRLHAIYKEEELNKRISIIYLNKKVNTFDFHLYHQHQAVFEPPFSRIAGTICCRF
jgi:hypothetical protein